MGYGKGKIRVCFVLATAYPLFNGSMKIACGGAEADLYNIAVKLAGNGEFSVQFLTGDYGQNNVEFYRNVAVKKVRYLNIRTYDSMHHKVLRQLYIWKELVLAGSDVYITETAGEMPGWIVLIEKFIKRRKVIFRLASDADADLRKRRKEGLKFYLLYKTGLFNADYVVCQSEGQKKLLLENTGIGSAVIRNGFFINGNPGFHVKKHILWVSRAIRIKRPLLFVELARRLPQESFVMIMPADSAAREDGRDEPYGLRNEVRESVTALNNIKLLDYVPFDEIHAYYEEAKLFVNTSEYEGFPNSFVQACLAGTPILSFNVNPDNFIVRYDMGCFCNNDTDKAVDFIRNLDEKKVGLLGENAFNYAIQNHNIDSIVKKYEDMCRGRSL